MFPLAANRAAVVDKQLKQPGCIARGMVIVTTPPLSIGALTRIRRQGAAQVSEGR